MKAFNFLARALARRQADRLQPDKNDPTRVKRNNKRYLKTRTRRHMALASRRGNR